MGWKDGKEYFWLELGEVGVRWDSMFKIIEHLEDKWLEEEVWAWGRSLVMQHLEGSAESTD